MANKSNVVESEVPKATKAKPKDSIENQIIELRGDLRRVVELLISGKMDSSKFREILDKKQGA